MQAPDEVYWHAGMSNRLAPSTVHTLFVAFQLCVCVCPACCQAVRSAIDASGIFQAKAFRDAVVFRCVNTSSQEGFVDTCPSSHS